ncbi:hypothetical protein AWB92_26720 [Mycobacterium sp. IEC1808]|nr:hypothetical protein AWB92_26720 [Mycobacterium sp. IEC1808]
MEQQAEAALRALTPVPAVPANLDPYQIGEISEEWVTAVLAHESAVSQWEARRRVLVNFKQRATSNTSGVLAANWNPILRQLNASLAAILNVAADLACDLGPASTAAQAIATDVGEAWKRLSELADEYRSVRAAQEFISLRLPQTYLVSSRPSLGGEEHASDLYLRNLDSLWPAWRNPDAVARINIDGSKPRLEPWPVDDTELLLWLVRSDAQAWIPTTFELDQLWRERHDRANPQRVEPGDEPEDESSAHDSLLWGPLDAKRRTQAVTAQRRTPDYGRVATPLTRVTKDREPELVNPLGEAE